MNIQDIKEMVLINLKNVVEEGDTFMPVAFVKDEKDHLSVIGCPFKDDESKIEVMRAVGFTAAKMKSKEFFVVIDSYIRKVGKNEDPKWVTDNWDVEKPSSYPEQMRHDCLIISHLFPNSPEKDQIMSIEYSKKDGEIIFGEESLRGSEGHFDGLIKDSIMEGYAGTISPDIHIEPI